ALYRAEFRPSARLQRPYAMVGVTVIAAETDERAAFLATSLEQAVVNLRSGRRAPLPAPRAGLRWGPLERSILDEFLGCSAIGSPRAGRGRAPRRRAQGGAGDGHWGTHD